jgi:hypothetical protein
VVSLFVIILGAHEDEWQLSHQSSPGVVSNEVVDFMHYGIPVRVY